MESLCLYRFVKKNQSYSFGPLTVVTPSSRKSLIFINLKRFAEGENWHVDYLYRTGNITNINFYSKAVVLHLHFILYYLL